MHIAEGAISGSLSGIAILVTGGIATAGATAVALQRLKEEDIPRTALLSAAFFVASFVQIPFGIVSFHLVLNGLVGVILGWEAFPAILVALWFQAILFGHGGLTTLGVNTVCMATPAVVCYYLCRRWLTRGPHTAFAAGFAAGVIGIMGGILLLAGALAVSGRAFVPLATIFVFWGGVWAIVEGFVSAAALAAIFRFRPELITGAPHPEPPAVDTPESVRPPTAVPELCAPMRE